MEQPGKGKEAQRCSQRVDKPFPVCGHEGTDGRTGWMAAPQNQGGVLDTMEKSTNEVQDAEGVTPARVEST